MTLSTVTVYADDANAWIEREVIDNKGGDLAWTATVAVDSTAYTITATWQGATVSFPAPGGTTRTKRVLRVPLVGLTVGMHRLYLQVPNGPDTSLGAVNVTNR